MDSTADSAPGRDLRVVIADDEPLARRLLARLVETEPGLLVVGVATDGEHARQLIAETRPDLVFLDIMMPRLSGVELMRRFGDDPWQPRVIFVTAFDHYAAKAFDLDALDYLVKPIEKARFARAVERARQALTKATERSDADAAAATTASVRIRQGDEIVDVPERAIGWLEAASQYVRIHTGDRTFIVAETLGAFHRRLRSQAFIRVHRSAVVNVTRVARVLRRSNRVHELELDTGDRVPLSRSRRRLLADILGASARRRFPVED